MLPGCLAVDTVLDPANPDHAGSFAIFRHVVLADLAVESDPASANNAGCPPLVLITDNGTNARFKTEADRVPEARVTALASLYDLIDVISSIGCETSVLDERGDKIKMDCDRLSISNMEALLTLMQAGGQTSMIIRDFNNGFHNLTVAQIQVLHIDLLTNGMGAYQIKWTAEAQIQAASTLAEIDAIMAALPHRS
jgi:hypothetical protein